MATTRQDVFGSTAFRVGVAQSLLWLGMGVTGLSVVSNFQKLVADFGAELPAATTALFSLVNLLSRYWYVGFLPLALWPFLTLGIVSLLSLSPELVILRRLWYVVTWIFPPLVVVVVGSLAVLLPFVKLVQKLS